MAHGVPCTALCISVQPSLAACALAPSTLVTTGGLSFLQHTSCSLPQGLCTAVPQPTAPSVHSLHCIPTCLPPFWPLRHSSSPKALSEPCPALPGSVPLHASLLDLRLHTSRVWGFACPLLCPQHLDECQGHSWPSVSRYSMNDQSGNRGSNWSAEVRGDPLCWKQDPRGSRWHRQREEPSQGLVWTGAQTAREVRGSALPGPAGSHSAHRGVYWTPCEEFPGAAMQRTGQKPEQMQDVRGREAQPGGTGYEEQGGTEGPEGCPAPAYQDSGPQT